MLAAWSRAVPGLRGDDDDRSDTRGTLSSKNAALVAGVPGHCVVPGVLVPQQAAGRGAISGLIVDERGVPGSSRWDGDTLVVDTVGFAPGRLAGSLPHSNQLHVVERFTLNPATFELSRDIVAEDPLGTSWTSTWTTIVSCRRMLHSRSRPARSSRRSIS